MNKRGQGLSTNAIVLIVLAVVVLAVLILGFTLGWGSIAPWLSSNNVDDIATQCSVACDTTSEYSFCSQPRNLVAHDVELEDVTCDYLSKYQKTYGIDECSTISCDVVYVEVSAEESLADKCGEDNGMIYGLVDNTLESYYCPSS